MEKQPIITDDVMQFIVFAIESAAEKSGIASPELYNRLQRLGLIDSYLVANYEALHSQGKEYIADAVLEALDNWEKKGEKKK